MKLSYKVYLEVVNNIYIIYLVYEQKSLFLIMLLFLWLGTVKGIETTFIYNTNIFILY